MKRLCLLALASLVLSSAAIAQPAPLVPVRLKVDWILPTTAADGSPLTGALALTELRLYVESAPIADDATPAPVLTLTDPTATTATITRGAPHNSTLYVRMRACNVGGCSVFTSQATAQVRAPVPGAPGGVTITVTVTVTVTPP